MSEHIDKRHNKSLLFYHLVCPIKYRRSILSESVELSLVEVCINIEKRFEVKFIEIESCSFFDSKCSNVISKNNSSNSKEYYSKRTFSTSFRGKTTIMRRSVLG
jgi:hypothetical protein